MLHAASRLHLSIHLNNFFDMFAPLCKPNASHNICRIALLAFAPRPGAPRSGKQFWEAILGSNSGQQFWEAIWEAILGRCVPLSASRGKLILG